MQTNKLKTYAPKARRDFIAAVTRRAAAFGPTAKEIKPNREEGELVFIEGQAYPKAVGRQRRRLVERIRQQGFEQVMEAAAYTWFRPRQRTVGPGWPSPLRPRKPPSLATMRMASPRVGGVAGGSGER